MHAIRRTTRTLLLTMVPAALPMLAEPGLAQAVGTTRVSTSSTGVQGTAQSHSPSLSADGRFVAFTSFAPELVDDDSNVMDDVFLHDRLAGSTVRITVNAAGLQGNGNSRWATISADGLVIAYVSGASNLIAGDTNGWDDIYVFDRITGAHSRVSVDSSGAQADKWSEAYPVLSADGRYVAFQSAATNLVSGDTNGADDIFVHDRETGTTSRVSVSSTGSQASLGAWGVSISADGQLIAFTSDSNDLVASDTNFGSDAFVHDRTTGTTTLVSVDSAGNQIAGSGSIEPYLSADGRYVAFTTSAAFDAADTNFWEDIYVRDLLAGTTARVSVSSTGAQANFMCLTPCVSGDGRYVSFYSSANTLVSGDTNGFWDVFLHDRVTGETALVSVDSAGNQGDGYSPWSGWRSTLSADGRAIAFDSAATNLVSGDTNDMPDAFVHDLGPLPSTWNDLGYGLAGVSGVPLLVGTGPLTVGSAGTLDLSQAAPSAPAVLFMSASSTPAGFKGGTLVPVPWLLQLSLLTDVAGTIPLSWPAWPGGLSGTSLYFQYAVLDAAAPVGVSLSNALRANVP